MASKYLKIFDCDLNWTYFDQPFVHTPPSMPHDFAFIDPLEYFNWHRDFGNNTMFLQAYTFCGYAFYPTRLGPVAPGPGQDFLPKMYDLSVKHGFPFCSYFCVSADLITSNMRDQWVVPTSRDNPYTRVRFPGPRKSLDGPAVRAHRMSSLTQFPVEYLLFDWFDYGNLDPHFKVQPAWFVKKPFVEIIGREMPETAAEITPDESLRYKREVLARQFRRIQETVRQGQSSNSDRLQRPLLPCRRSIMGGSPHAGRQ